MQHDTTATMARLATLLALAAREPDAARRAQALRLADKIWAHACARIATPRDDDDPQHPRR
jgi:hypothetical protein